ncbi:phage tail sheath family protein, partial [Agromyces humi]|uniref:phage tail sheath family protein n=1 Tax=Agromyces humi TaxID=1766800 RepID=UPI00139697A0
PGRRPIVWGARTLAAGGPAAAEWKYVPVRRTALFLEESIERGLQWTVFEPNDEPLWQEVRESVGAFLHDLFRAGAFHGRSAAEAYFVRCGRETTTQEDLDAGELIVLMGFAPIRPAEFVVLRIRTRTRRPGE